MNEQVTNSKRGRKQLLLLTALFLAPVVVSWAAWLYLSNGGNVSVTNAGELVQPARPLVPVALQDDRGQPWSIADIRGRWAYVMFAGQACTEECDRQLYYTRQIRTGVSKDMSRVRRVLVLGYQPRDEWIKRMRRDHPDLTLVVAQGDAWDTFAGQFAVQAVEPAEGVFFMVDPLGNLMMRYDASVSAKGIAKDLRKLLKVSQVG